MQNIDLTSNEKNHELTDYLNIQSAEAMGLNFEIAGVGARSHAFVIDWHIRFLLAIVWLFVCGVALFSLDDLFNSPWENASSNLVYLWFVPAGIIYFFYHPVLEIVMGGKTPGKKIAGIKIVTLNGLTPSTGALLIRNVFRLLDSLPSLYIFGLGSVALTRNHVRIGDLAANLVLVYDNEVSQKELQKVSQLTLHSNLGSSDQILLLDIISRWKQMHLEDRIRLSEQFLRKIGEDITQVDSNKNKYSKYLFSRLNQLTEVARHD